MSIFRTVAGWVGRILSFIRTHWKAIIRIMTGPVGTVVMFVIGHFNQIIHFISGLGGRIGHAASGMWDGIKDAFKTAINWILTAWNALHFSLGGWHVGTHIAGKWVGGTIPKVNVGMPHVPLLASGGTVTGLGSWITGDAGPELNTMLPGGGVRVQPLDTTKIDTSLAASIAHTTIVQLDRKTIATAVSRFSEDKKARS
jgi:hypothetical protein